MKISKWKLHLAMAECGFNFDMLSKCSGISRTTLSYINSGKSCRIDIAAKIAKALNVKCVELLESEGGRHER